MSSVRGTVSKALLMSIVANRVRGAGSGMFRPSCMCCVSGNARVDHNGAKDNDKKKQYHSMRTRD